MKTSPSIQALGGAIITPFTVVAIVAVAGVLLIVAGLLLICWPLVPILLYRQRKAELADKRPLPDCFGDYPINSADTREQRECNSCRCASDCYSKTLKEGKNVAQFRTMA